MRVSVLELPASWAEPDEALREVDRLLALAPTELAVLPEMSLCGYVSPEADFELGRFAEAIDGPTMRAVATLAARHATTIVAPLVLADGDARFNAAVAIGPDGRTIYRKRHPWFPEEWATPGTAPHPTFRVGALTVTIAICYDGHFLAAEAAAQLSQADLLVFTSAWVDEKDSRLPLLRSIARRFGVTIANANWGPGVVHVPGQGGSCVISPVGDVVARVEPRGGRRVDADVQPRLTGS